MPRFPDVEPGMIQGGPAMSGPNVSAGVSVPMGNPAAEYSRGQRSLEGAIGTILNHREIEQRQNDALSLSLAENEFDDEVFKLKTDADQQGMHNPEVYAAYQQGVEDLSRSALQKYTGTNTGQAQASFQRRAQLAVRNGIVLRSNAIDNMGVQWGANTADRVARGVQDSPETVFEGLGEWEQYRERMFTTMSPPLAQTAYDNGRNAIARASVERLLRDGNYSGAEQLIFELNQRAPGALTANDNDRFGTEITKGKSALMKAGKESETFGGYTKDQATFGRDVQKQFDDDKRVVQYRQTKPQIDAAIKLAAEDTPTVATDRALVSAYSKLLDPSTGVLQGESDALTVASWEMWLKSAKNWVDGGADSVMSDEMRTALINGIREIAGGIQRNYDDAREEYGGQLQKVGVSPDFLTAKPSRLVSPAGSKKKSSSRGSVADRFNSFGR